MSQTEVLICGAGPTGLILALWLQKQGCRVRIIDKSKGPGETSRAMAVHARTLELYHQMDIADEVVAAGYKAPAMNIWARGAHRARIPLVDAGQKVSLYPFVLIFPQDKHEQLLIERLKSFGVEVERETELVSFVDRGNGVTAILRDKNGHEVSCDAQYLAGCDGARSTIRRQIGSGFEGGTYDQLFYVADVVASGIEPTGEGHIAFDKSEFILLLPYSQVGQYRLIGTVRDERALHPENLTFEDVGHDAINGLHIKVSKVNWFSTYKVHHRVADHFRYGRVFLLGDAAHVHSPAGGQGMNTGILDAINLAWKLSFVLKGKAPDSLLDTYEVERQAFARKLVKTTDQLFSFVTAQGWFADFIRTHIAPVIAANAYKFHFVREYVFRVISQTTLNYHNSSLSVGKVGAVQGGDRLPWAVVEGVDNYEPLSDISWQVHVYGEAKEDLQAWCKLHQIPLHVFLWRSDYENVGLTKDVIYLLRPDTYVALVDPDASVTSLSQYFNERGLSP